MARFYVLTVRADSGVIDYAEISAMVKLSVFLIGLCLFVLPARSIGLSHFAMLCTQQQDEKQQKDTTAGVGKLRVCDSDAPVNCHAVDGVTAPKVLYAPDPKFTRLARKKKLSGKSVVGIIVGVDGKPYNVHLIRSMSEGLDQSLQQAALELDQKAVEAVQRYKFRPATRQGKPVPVEVHVEVNFLVY